MTTNTIYPYTTGEHMRGSERTRLDTYHGDVGNVPQRVLCAHRHDFSPVYRGEYDADCASCWLGYCHSEANHAQTSKMG